MSLCAIIFGVAVGVGTFYCVRYHEAMKVVKALREDLSDAYSKQKGVLDKACKYLTSGSSLLDILLIKDSDDLQEFVKNFRKAMEE